MFTAKALKKRCSHTQIRLILDSLIVMALSLCFHLITNTAIEKGNANCEYFRRQIETKVISSLEKDHARYLSQGLAYLVSYESAWEAIEKFIGEFWFSEDGTATKEFNNTDGDISIYDANLLQKRGIKTKCTFDESKLCYYNYREKGSRINREYYGNEVIYKAYSLIAQD